MFKLMASLADTNESGPKGPAAQPEQPHLEEHLQPALEFGAPARPCQSDSGVVGSAGEAASSLPGLARVGTAECGGAGSKPSQRTAVRGAWGPVVAQVTSALHERQSGGGRPGCHGLPEQHTPILDKGGGAVATGQVSEPPDKGGGAVATGQVSEPPAPAGAAVPGPAPCAGELVGPQGLTLSRWCKLHIEADRAQVRSCVSFKACPWMMSTPLCLDSAGNAAC
jgi:hypothetical protein